MIIMATHIYNALCIYLQSLKDGTYDTNYFKKTPLTHYPLNALTRVDYNPNERSYGFVAIGMYAGFVRVRYIGEVQNPETN